MRGVAMTNLVPTLKAPVDLIGAVLDSLTSKNTRAAYSRELRLFTAFCAESGLDLSRMTVQLYRSHLLTLGKSSSSTNLSISAVKCLVREAAEQGCLDDGTAGAILRIKGVEKRGRRTGSWMTLEQAKALRDAPDDTLIGKRDSVILGLLLGCGLRRSEASTLTVDQFQTRDGRHVLDSVVGKHHRVRTVPCPKWAATRIKEWLSVSGITSGLLLRSLRFGDVREHGLSSSGIYYILQGYGWDLELDLAPHNLRRSFSVLAKRGGADMTNLRDSLGHSSIQTTESYVGASMLLENASCDKTGLED